jgi:hypothetical protein
MTQPRGKRWLEANRSTLIICIVFAVVIGVLLYRRIQHRRQEARQHYRAYRAAMARAQIVNSINFPTPQRLYFESLGTTAPDSAPLQVRMQTRAPQHPRVLKAHPSLLEMEKVIGPAVNRDRETAAWIFRPGGLPTQISAQFKNNRLIAATLEIGPYREHLGLKAEEWEWHDAQ